MHLSRASLEDFEGCETGLVSIRIKDLFSLSPLHSDAVGVYVFGSWTMGGKKNPNHPSVERLFEDKLNLI